LVVAFNNHSQVIVSPNAKEHAAVEERQQGEGVGPQGVDAIQPQNHLLQHSQQ
jgi:hypothetical protein